MSTPDAALIALGERFERRLLEYMDAWLAWAPLMRAARAEADSDLAGFRRADRARGAVRTASARVHGCLARVGAADAGRTRRSGKRPGRVHRRNTAHRLRGGASPHVRP